MRKRLFCVILLSLMLTACANTVQTSEITLDSDNSSAEESAAETADIEKDSAEAASEIAQEPTADEENATAPDNFSLADHISGFDEAEPISYTLDDSLFTYEYNKSPAIEEAALEAVRSSEYLEAINAEAREMLEYKDGKYTCPEEKWSFLADTYIEYMGEDFKVEPRILQTRSAYFDGENREYLFTFIVPLHYEFMEWSGTTTFVIPVYVNSNNEAFILADAARQTLSLPELLHYSDGVVHAAFVWGHSSGTSGSAIYSFKDGRPVLEFTGGGLSYERGVMGGDLLFNDISGFFGHGSLFFRDGIRDRYCGVEGVPASDELAEMLRAKADFPASDSDRGSILIFGGRYITCEDKTFQLRDGILDDCEYGNVIRTDDGDYKYWVNIDLEQY